MINFRHNIVEVLCIYEHEHQASPSETTRKFDSIITWRQFSTYHNKSLGKKDQ